MEEIKENKMGYMPVNKLLLSMSLPMMASMMVQALYNIVDSIFVSRVSENALTAVSMAFPLQCLMIAIAGGTCVGINAILSKALGEKDYERANLTASNGIFLSVLSYGLFLIIGLLFVGPFYKSQTTDTEIIEYGIQYMTVVCTCSFGLFGQFIFERLLTSTGRTFYTMITQATGAIINIIFDPILIFGLFGFPKMGVTGAAVATVIGQICAAILAYIMNVKKNPDIKISMKGFRPDGALIGEIYKIGIPSIIMQSIGSVMNYIMNKILIGFTSTAVAVFGVYYKMQSFIFMPIFGMNSGMIPIIAYNYGAKKKDRIMSTLKYAVIAATCIMLCGTLLFNLFPEWFMNLFSAQGELMTLGCVALGIISFHFVFAGFNIVVLSSYQALGNGTYALIVSVLRQLVVILPAAFILGKLFGVNAVWWAFPIAEVVSTIVNICLFKKIYKDKIVPLTH